MSFSNMKWRISGHLFQRVVPGRNDLHQQQPTEHHVDADTETHRVDRVAAAEQTAEDSEGQALEHSFGKIDESTFSAIPVVFEYISLEFWPRLIDKPYQYFHDS